MLCEYARPDRLFFRFDNPMAQVVRFSRIVQRLRPSDIQSRKRAWSLNSICFPPQQAAAEQWMNWMVTQLYSDVASRHDTQSTGGVSFRGQTTVVDWRGLEPRDQEKRTRRAPLYCYVPVYTAAAVSHVVPTYY